MMDEMNPGQPNRERPDGPAKRPREDPPEVQICGGSRHFISIFIGDNGEPMELGVALFSSNPKSNLK